MNTTEGDEASGGDDGIATVNQEPDISISSPLADAKQSISLDTEHPAKVESQIDKAGGSQNEALTGGDDQEKSIHVRDLDQKAEQIVIPNIDQKHYTKQIIVPTSATTVEDEGVPPPPPPLTPEEGKNEELPNFEEPPNYHCSSQMVRIRPPISPCLGLKLAVSAQAILTVCTHAHVKLNKTFFIAIVIVESQLARSR